MFFNELTYTINVPEEFRSMNAQLHSVRLSYGCDVFERDVNIPLENEQEFLGFYFNLSNNLHYNFGDSLSGVLHQGQYIFIFQERMLNLVLRKENILHLVFTSHRSC
jgi:hypothetical protein